VITYQYLRTCSPEWMQRYCELIPNVKREEIGSDLDPRDLESSDCEKPAELLNQKDGRELECTVRRQLALGLRVPVDARQKLSPCCGLTSPAPPDTFKCLSPLQEPSCRRVRCAHTRNLIAGLWD